MFSHLKHFVAAGAVVAMGLLVSPSAARADIISTTPQQLTATFGTLGSSQTLTFNGFDSSLGALTGVYVSFSFSGTLNNTVFNATGGTVDVGSPTPLTATATVNITGTGGLAATTSVSTAGFTGSVPFTAGVATIGTINFGPLSSSASITSGLDAYIGGTNSVSILAASTGNQGGSVPDSVYTGNNGNGSAIVSLYYTYQVPEPASMALLGTGLLGLGVIVRRRRNV